eukprot:CAMPEP_0172563044 /NCGR_PEP_ID=MMETSP1067-20121228/99312_1 /TAXON_ID=265564 ORGANISM="Thalassiosira punctigera, Strain Tpunct2005C2" /NCGR_SAMPLE_ID=MMETSP1067 /ASSEMBLY_ACC=CAM_ASM_000444 /LENGTH=61 /DNA_ID=CAMNT_0013353395 /DNA_START=178 /DNA_END=360 /DNA_ORIENTATION=+
MKWLLRTPARYLSATSTACTIACAIATHGVCEASPGRGFDPEGGLGGGGQRNVHPESSDEE